MGDGVWEGDQSLLCEGGGVQQDCRAHGHCRYPKLWGWTLQSPFTMERFHFYFLVGSKALKGWSQECCLVRTGSYDHLSVR